MIPDSCIYALISSLNIGTKRNFAFGSYFSFQIALSLISARPPAELKSEMFCKDLLGGESSGTLISLDRHTGAESKERRSLMSATN